MSNTSFLLPLSPPRRDRDRNADGGEHFCPGFPAPRHAGNSSILPPPTSCITCPSSRRGGAIVQSWDTLSPSLKRGEAESRLHRWWENVFSLLRNTVLPLALLLPEPQSRGHQSLNSQNSAAEGEGLGLGLAVVGRPPSLLSFPSRWLAPAH